MNLSVCSIGVPVLSTASLLAAVLVVVCLLRRLATKTSKYSVTTTHPPVL